MMRPAASSGGFRKTLPALSVPPGWWSRLRRRWDRLEYRTEHQLSDCDVARAIAETKLGPAAGQFPPLCQQEGLGGHEPFGGVAPMTTSVHPHGTTHRAGDSHKELEIFDNIIDCEEHENEIPA